MEAKAGSIGFINRPRIHLLPQAFVLVGTLLTGDLASSHKSEVDFMCLLMKDSRKSAITNVPAL